MRNQRLETSIELRKAKREEQALKRRNICEDEEEKPSPLGAHNQQKRTMPSIAELPAIIAGIQSGDPAQVFANTKKCR